MVSVAQKFAIWQFQHCTAALTSVRLSLQQQKIRALPSSTGGQPAGLQRAPATYTVPVLTKEDSMRTSHALTLVAACRHFATALAQDKGIQHLLLDADRVVHAGGQ